MKKQVLIIDDEQPISELIAEVCAIEDIEAIQCNDSRELESLLEQHPNLGLIFLDLNMPNRDGIEVLRYLSDIHCRASIALMSGFDDSVLSTASELALEFGLRMLPSISKPFNVKRIFSTLETFNFAELNDDGGVITPILNGKLPSSTVQQWLKNNQIEMHYQPQFCMRSNNVVGVEALVRLVDEQGNVVYPGAFIDSVEDAGLTKLLLTKVVEKVLHDFESNHPYLFNLNVSINVSALDLDRLDFPDELFSQINSSNLTPTNVTVEITESRAIEQISKGLDILARLRLKGFHLSIDDFGTGEAVLGHIRKMPYNELKIDKSFVDQLTTSIRTHSLTHDLIKMARHLGLSIVAEGIEDSDTASILREMGCDIAQGFYFAKPMPVAALVPWLRNYK